MKRLHPEMDEVHIKSKLVAYTSSEYQQNLTNFENYYSIKYYLTIKEGKRIQYKFTCYIRFINISHRLTIYIFIPIQQNRILA